MNYSRLLKVFRGYQRYTHIPDLQSVLGGLRFAAPIGLHVALLFVLGACASPMHVRAFQEIQVGDPASKVIGKFGTPDLFEESKKIPGAQAWYYRSHGSVCGFTIKDNVVAYRACDASRYVSGAGQGVKAFGSILQGFGQGAQDARKPLNCTPDGGNGYNCR